MIPGILLFALAVAGFGLMQPKPMFLIYAIFCIAGFISGVQTPIPYAAVITHWFDSHRGMALGLTTAGVGLGVALIPQLAAFLIIHFGWRHAYFGLGLAVVVLAWIPVVIFVRDPPWVSPARGCDFGIAGNRCRRRAQEPRFLAFVDSVFSGRVGDQWHDRAYCRAAH
jgi:MFS family permease